MNTGIGTNYSKRELKKTKLSRREGRYVVKYNPMKERKVMLYASIKQHDISDYTCHGLIIINDRNRYNETITTVILIISGV